MRFMLLMIPQGYESADPGAMPDAKAVEAMMKYNEALQQAGVLVSLEGLHPPSMGARITFNGGNPKVTEGVSPNVKEVLGGYWMIQVNSKEEAIEWASRCPASDNETIEIRQVQEFEDFSEDVQQAAAGFVEMEAQGTTRSTDEALIRELLEKWADATRLGKHDEVLVFHASDVTIFDVLPPLKYEGADAYRKSWDEWQPTTESSGRFEIHDLKITAGQDVAFAHCLIHCGGAQPDGGTFEDWVRATFCLHKLAGKWLVTHQHISMPIGKQSGNR